MYKNLLITFLLTFLISCSSNLNREIIRLDPTNENYHTPGCREIRKKILDQKSDPSESCLLYTSPSPRDTDKSRMPSSA